MITKGSEANWSFSCDSKFSFQAGRRGSEVETPDLSGQPAPPPPRNGPALDRSPGVVLEGGVFSTAKEEEQHEDLIVAKGIFFELSVTGNQEPQQGVDCELLEEAQEWFSNKILSDSPWFFFCPWSFSYRKQQAQKQRKHNFDMYRSTSTTRTTTTRAAAGATTTTSHKRAGSSKDNKTTAKTTPPPTTTTRTTARTTTTAITTATTRGPRTRASSRQPRGE